MIASELALSLFGIALYTVGSVLAVIALLRPSPRMDRWVLMLAACGAFPLMLVLGLHAVETGHIRALTRFEAFVAYGVILTFAYFGMCFKRPRARGLSAFVVPYVTVTLILGLPEIHAETVIAPKIQNVWLRIHIASAFLGYASFSLAALMAVAYLIQDRKLKQRDLGQLGKRLPALETLDRLMTVQVGIAFLMLTVSIVLGVLLIRLTGGGGEWVLDPKVVATVLTWCIFAALVHMRAWANQHGRRVALVIIMGLLCLFFAFIGVHVVANSVHDYIEVGGSVSTS